MYSDMTTTVSLANFCCVSVYLSIYLNLHDNIISLIGCVVSEWIQLNSFKIPVSKNVLNVSRNSNWLNEYCERFLPLFRSWAYTHAKGHNRLSQFVAELLPYSLYIQSSFTLQPDFFVKQLSIHWHLYMLHNLILLLTR